MTLEAVNTEFVNYNSLLQCHNVGVISYYFFWWNEWKKNLFIVYFCYTMCAFFFFILSFISILVMFLCFALWFFTFLSLVYEFILRFVTVGGTTLMCFFFLFFFPVLFCSLLLFYTFPFWFQSHQCILNYAYVTSSGFCLQFDVYFLFCNLRFLFFCCCWKKKNTLQIGEIWK